MIDNLVKLDKEFFLFLNDRHIDWLDPLMILLSSYAAWAVVFILFGILIFINRQSHKIASVLFYAASVTLSTLLTNGLKLLVQRPRPIHESAWEGVIHNIERYSTASSFFSSHAATTFCIAAFVFFSIKTKRYIGCIAFVWAAAVSYSRIYVGKHYPLDITVGILFGIFMGYLGNRMLEKYIETKDGLKV